MSPILATWLETMERRIVNRRDSTSTLVFVEFVLPLLLLLFGLQLFAALHAETARLYNAHWLWPSLWGQVILMGWLVFMGVLAWQQRREHQPMNWLVQLTIVPATSGILALSVLHGYKDTSMGMLMLIGFIMLRSLFPVRQLKCLLLGAVSVLVVCELALAARWMTYAPLLQEPIFVGRDMHWWWSLWNRTVFVAANLPMAGWIFFLAATLHRNRAALDNIARTDVLTGLVNRREFMERLDKESHRQARQHNPMAVIMLDVDHFKRINDTHGHPAGDKVLARIGQILRSIDRTKVDVAGRYGGEEFVVLLPDTDLTGAIQVAEKIRSRIAREKFRMKGQWFSATVSAGVAEMASGDSTSALKMADDNLYRAKSAGRNCVVSQAGQPTPKAAD